MNDELKAGCLQFIVHRSSFIVHRSSFIVQHFFSIPAHRIARSLLHFVQPFNPAARLNQRAISNPQKLLRIKGIQANI
jgi:hypothetical protein